MSIMRWANVNDLHAAVQVNPADGLASACYLETQMTGSTVHDAGAQHARTSTNTICANTCRTPYRKTWLVMMAQRGLGPTFGRRIKS